MEKIKMKKTKKAHFNLFDVLLLLIFLAALALLAYIFLFRSSPAEAGRENREITYVLETKEIREELRGLVQVGDKVVDTVAHYPLGEVINVQYSEMEYTGLDEATGEMVTSPYPNHIKVTVTVRATAQISDGSYSIGGYRMSVGSKVYFRVPHFTETAFCTSLTEKAADEMPAN